MLGEERAPARAGARDATAQLAQVATPSAGEPREPQNVALGRAIRTLRKEAGLTQDELAERAQVPVEKLRPIEAGTVDARWGTLRHVAYALETELAELFRLAEFDHAEEQQQDQSEHGRDEQ